MTKSYERYQPDLESYIRRTQTGPCFVCKIVERDQNFFHHVVYEDDCAIAFLNKYPTQYGYTIVAPKEHLEQVTGDFSVEEYLALQRVVYAVSEAVRLETEAERVYLLSLGSNQGNSHVHWCIVPLPTGIPYDEQQFSALRLEDAGALRIPEKEKVALSTRIRRRIEQQIEGRAI